MGFTSDIERRLWAYLSPRKRAEVIAAVDAEDEDDAPNECPGCGARIGEHDSFCGDRCQGEFEESTAIAERRISE